MRYLLFVSLFFTVFANGQTLNKTDSNRVRPGDTLVIDSGFKDSLKIFKPTINDYQYQTQFSEKKVFDTVLTADKTYIFSQYNNRDNFGCVPFANIGAGFQQLLFEFNPEQNLSLLPTNKSYLIKRIGDIRYYDVKTPTTAFVYHNAMRNGAALQSTYTQNIGKNFNFAVEYIGLRSQGLYRNSLAANNSLEFSAHYRSPKGKYEAFAHFIHHNINNQENGGIADVDQFLNGDSDFNNRENLEVNLNSSDSRFAYRRFYYSHEFRPFLAEKFPFKIRHTIYNQSNKYYFNQTAPEPYFLAWPNELIDYPLSSKKYSSNLSNTVSVLFDYENFKLDAGIRHQHIGLGIGSALPALINVPQKESENRLGAVGNLQINLWNKVSLDANLEFSRGNTFGNFLRSQNQLRFEPIEGYFVNGKVNFQTATPTFNLLLNPSVYRNFNYYLADPKNETVTEIGGDVNLKWFETKVSASFFRIDNYTFIGTNGQPQQSSSSVNISQLGAAATFSYRKFHFAPQVMLQSTLGSEDLLPLPAVVGRANIYWQSKAFKDAAEIQTGMKLHYFSKFSSREFFPVLNEFIQPGKNAQSIGGQPAVDVYFNLKVKRMFFFIEAQHINTSVFKNKLFAAPYYPTSDFRLNLGIVWYLFS